MMVAPGDVLSYLEMCELEGVSLQRGMNYRLRGTTSVILMSIRPGAPYADRIEDNGRVLIYEGHDAPKTGGGPDPKTVDQPTTTLGGALTQNGLFLRAVFDYRTKKREAELVKVYEKIRTGIWVYNGLFRLVDAWQEMSGKRKVFKFRLVLIEDGQLTEVESGDIDHNRLIPTSVKLEVWRRDRGRCVKCGSRVNLHFDHIIPYSKGGSSLVAENIQLLCARHNLAKHDRIE